ncbi:hypothetical protein QYF61_004521 [Mycteria americana]|uniref:Uncharacterized protein n=1 Tax=Mycteria americana TaxID=33587 RepID=A0AAN7RWY6_MYCAM|nr:hypothetical protein QYF61_004521 [Mycteria americana]
MGRPLRIDNRKADCLDAHTGNGNSDQRKRPGSARQCGSKNDSGICLNGRRAQGGGEQEREREQDVRDVESTSEDARFQVLPDLTMYGQRSHRVYLRKGLATAPETPRDHPTPPAPAQKIENFLEQEPCYSILTLSNSRVVGRVTTMTQRNSLASNFINWRIPQTDKLNDLTSLTNEQRRFGNGAILRASRSQTCIYILEKQRKREEKQEKERRREEKRERKSITTLGSRDDDDRRGNPPVVLEGCYKVSPEPSLLQAEQPQISQPVFIGEVLQPSDHLRGPPLDSLQQVHVLLMSGVPEVNTVLQDMVGFLGCKCTLPGHVELLINQHPQVLLLRAGLNPFPAQPVFVLGIAPTHVQALALGLVELHEVCTGPLLKPVEVPLDGIPSLQCVDHTTRLGVICKLAEGALNPTVHVANKDVKQHRSQYRPLRNATHHWSPRPVHHLNVSLVVGGPKLNTVFEVRPHQCRVQGHDHFPSPAGHAIFDTSQDAIGFLGRLGTVLAHIQPAVNQHPQVLLCQAAFQPLFPKPVVLHGVVVAQVQDLALSLVEPHTIGPSPLIQPVQVPLQTLPTLQQINTPTQLGVICKLTEGALDPFVQIIDKDIKQDWPQHRALGNTACDQPPTGVNSIHHHSLGPAIQPVLYPAKSTPVQAMSSQFLQENAGCLPGDSVDQSPKQAKVCPPEVQGGSFADPPRRFSTYQKPYHFVITLPKMASNHHMAQKSFSVRVKRSSGAPSLAKQPQFPQPLLIRLLLQTLHQLRCPSLDMLQHLNVSLVVRGPTLNTVFEVRPHQCLVQGHDHFPSPAGHAIFDTSQDAIGFLGHLGTVLAHIQPAVNQHPQVLFCQAAFQPLFPKPVALHGVAVAQVQDLALSLVEPHTIGPSPLIQPVQDMIEVNEVRSRFKSFTRVELLIRHTLASFCGRMVK